MTTLPIFAIMLVAAILGGVNLYLRYHGQRKPVLIGVHLLAGLGALEVLVYYLKDANGGDGVPPGAYGNAAAGLLALAAFSGLVSPILGRNSRQTSNLLLTAHVAFGLVGIAIALVWVNHL